MNLTATGLTLGLSPRLRGNHCTVNVAPPNIGSIPAPAGEPPVRPLTSPTPRVYPRACGGTSFKLRHGEQTHGLSPRLRGNPTACPRGSLTARSIPAPAGEPQQPPAPPGIPSVYPRACGGTRKEAMIMTRYTGLSPRLRGNPPPRGERQHLNRSIPAPAGEPSRPR